MLKALACRRESADQPVVTRRNNLSEYTGNCMVAGSTHLDSLMAAGYRVCGTDRGDWFWAGDINVPEEREGDGQEQMR